MIDYEKRVISGLLTLSLILTMFTFVLPVSQSKAHAWTTDQLKGDTDGNGEITISDVTRLQKILADLIEVTEFDMIADVNGNGELDVRDATYIQLYPAKYIDSLEVL